MQHSPSVQCSETGQQRHHTLVLAVAVAACGLLSESRTSGNHISSHSTVVYHSTNQCCNNE